MRRGISEGPVSDTPVVESRRTTRRLGPSQRLRVFKSLSIQSKIVTMMLAVSLGSLGIIAYLGYTSGRAALADSIRRQLVSNRTAKTTELRDEFATIRDEVITLSGSEGVTNAMKAFKSAYATLNDVTVEREWDDKIRAFYANEFLPALKKNVEGEPVLDVYLPRLIPTRYLQYHYMVMSPKPYESKGDDLERTDPGPYGEVHRRYHPGIHDFGRRFGFEDVYLIDHESGDIVYSCQKTVDLGTSLLSGPYADSNLGELYRSVRRGMDRDDYQFTDFALYRPSLNKPSAFVASPVFDQNKMIGLLVLQFPIERINKLITGNYSWEASGLGKTGETYLVGSDYFLRSRSRFMYEDPKGMVEVLKRLGKPERLIKRVEQTGMLILNMKLQNPQVERALAGEEGVLDGFDYRNEPVLSSFGPVDLEGVRWAVISEMDQSEALGPITRYGRDVLNYSVGIVLGVTVLSILLSHWLVRPLQRLTKGAKQVGAGDVGVQIPVTSHDEFGELADAFNGMVRSLRSKTEQIEQKVQENEELLLNILPGPVAARMQGGEQEISDSFADVTVLYSDIEGFTEAAEALSAEDSLRLLNDLVNAFDEAAEKHGVEKVKTFGSGYLAVCGLSFERPDHTNRMVEFAEDLLRIMGRFNKERGTALALAIGINAGPVVGGVVGRSKFLYDLWGDTVNLARRVQEAGGKGTPLRVTDTVYARVKDQHSFEPGGEIEVPGKGARPVWGLAH